MSSNFNQIDRSWKEVSFRRTRFLLDEPLAGRVIIDIPIYPGFIDQKAPIHPSWGLLRRRVSAGFQWKWLSMQKKLIEIPKEQATFRMDGRGRWYNRHGPFQNIKIIRHFNASIQKDAKGYFVSQLRDGVDEKVYFHYEDTALFVEDVIWEDPPALLLNTGAKEPLRLKNLRIRNDQLYIVRDDICMKFQERAIYKIVDHIQYVKGRYYFAMPDGSERVQITCHDTLDIDAGGS